MRWSRFYIPTLKEAPADAEVVSHKLLTRAGMIRKLTSGIYTYMPLGLRSITKASAIVREEMDKAGGNEVSMPMVQPADLWQESGRWDFYGKELLRLKDRHNRDYCLGPTHEEVITDIVRGEVRSYRQLPMNLYQIQTKFRDEVRPRFGLMRGREFIMKDAYSFDKDQAGLDESYDAMYAAYNAIFSRMGLEFRPVEADSGSIGGSFSHEFMVLAETGEDTIVVCDSCSYAANVERAEILCSGEECAALETPMEEVSTPNARTIEEVSSFLNAPATAFVKTLLFDADGEPVAALVRGDRELNDVKLKNLLQADTLEMATPEQVREWTGAPVGFAGPVKLNVKRIYADNELRFATDWIVGANKADAHLKHVCLKRDVELTGYADLRVITENDVCPKCGKEISLPKGIEVGHVFKLGTKYSESLGCTFLDENGKEQVMLMGCYGIGVSRVVAACIEQNHDENGICFPPPIAPFEALVVNLDIKSDEVNDKVDEIYTFLKEQGIDVLVDDRKERPGVKFKDADLIGIPMQLVVGGRGLKNGIIEAKDRRTGEKTELPVEGFIEAFKEWKEKVYAGWNIG
ncbi:proline--tRNA ligase [Halodesulfovibrio marinisediminis]|uniref:Proline--tRNA ligase n=1 Tax=Halodesulfovibrio marinisediminis DSM 17456 TaxID=1121457 RepID=A0A1N6DMU9_9BACT|nr:proline--tRNA ligase [Halodesulfovibrio marinisediminis]SIN72004.1 prolyl-tRNA synthetase [Halodesulfovibrio marinisediminis DSM 17456]